MMYQTLIIDPLREMVLRGLGFIPTLFVSLLILVVGWLIARLLSKLTLRLFQLIDIDKLIAKLGVPHFFKDGGVDHKPSELLSLLVYWFFMVIVLVVAVKAFGLTMASDLLDKILAYIPSVISGAVVLMLGVFLAKIVATTVSVIGVNIQMPHTDVVSRLSQWAIVVFAVVAFLKEIGFGALFLGSNFMVLLGGIVFAVSLAFGLAGKDIAAKYLDVLKPKR